MYSKLFSLAAIASLSAAAEVEAQVETALQTTAEAEFRDVIFDVSFGNDGDDDDDDDDAGTSEPTEEPAETEPAEQCLFCQTICLWQCVDAIEEYQLAVVAAANALQTELNSLFAPLKKAYPLFRMESQTEAEFITAIRSLFTTAVLEDRAVIEPEFPPLLEIDCQCREQTEALRNELEHLYEAKSAIVAEAAFLKNQLCEDIPVLVAKLTEGAEKSLASANSLIADLIEDVNDLDAFQGSSTDPELDETDILGLYNTAK